MEPVGGQAGIWRLPYRSLVQGGGSGPEGAAATGQARWNQSCGMARRSTGPSRPGPATDTVPGVPEVVNPLSSDTG